MVEKWDQFKERHLLTGRLNINVDEDITSNLAKLFTLGPMVSQLKVNGGDRNFDYFGEGNVNFATCHDLYLENCKFTN